MPDLAPFLNPTHMSLSAREEQREGKGPGKLQGTTGGDAPYLRMMGNNSQCESRCDRSQSDMRERCACGAPACVLGSGDPSHLDCTRGSATFHVHVLCHARGRHPAHV
jgi:hypothetical protein